MFVITQNNKESSLTTQFAQQQAISSGSSQVKKSCIVYLLQVLMASTPINPQSVEQIRGMNGQNNRGYT